MRDRYEIARLIGRLNALSPPRDAAATLLLGPGRWGTSTPALGVPVSFAEISRMSVICEVAVMHEGLVPDVSLGTHFFNDLVELDMLYLAVFPGRQGDALNRELLGRLPNRLAGAAADGARWQHAVVVAESRDLPPGHRLFLHADSRRQQALCFVPDRAAAAAAAAPGAAGALPRPGESPR